MKKALDVMIISIICSSVFVAASAFRAFQINSIALIGPSWLYFLVGLALRTYYKQQQIVILFFGITVLWSSSMLLLPKIPNIQFILITNLLIIANLSLGYFFSSLPKIGKYLSFIAMIGLVYYLSFIYMPKDTAQKRMAVYSNLNSKPFVEFMPNTTLKDTSNNLVANYFQKDTIYLIEFFFKNCAPCRMKEKILPKVSEAFKNQPFKIIYVDNAEIDDFQSFTEGARKKAYAENFYDEKNILIQNLKIQGFPLEIILDKKGVIRHTYHGYSFDDDNEYFTITTNKIKNLLNE